MASKSVSAGASSLQGSNDKDGLEGIQYFNEESDEVTKELEQTHTKEQEQSRIR